MSKPLTCGGLVANCDPEVITPQDAERILETIRQTEFTQGVRIENGDLVRTMTGMTEEEIERHKQIIKHWKVMRIDGKRLALNDIVARKIREARERKGWTYYKLSQASGVNVGHLHRLEEGFLTPRIDTLNALCRALEIKIALPIDT